MGKIKMPFGKNKQDGPSKDTHDSANNIFFEKVGNFFDPKPQKEKVLRHEDFKGAGDTYYATVSVGYKISQRIIAVVLVFFLLFSLLANFREITYDNFFYLLKDFSAAVGSGASNYNTLSYDSNTRHFFALYRGGLTVVNPSNISAFTATGRRTLNKTSKFSSPCIEASDKYFIIYDISGNNFSVYNSFARVYSETLEYPVSAAAFAEDGTMAVVTRDISHKSMVHIYSKNFKRLFSVPSSSKYAFDVEMSSENDLLAISYYGIGDGSGRTEISMRKLSDMEEVGEILIDGEFLLDCGFIEDGLFAAVTDRAIRIYDKYFEELDAYEYDNGTVSGYEVSRHGVTVSYKLNSKNSAIVFDKFGKLLYNESISDTVNDIGIFDGYVFLRNDEGVLRINLGTLDEQRLTSSQGKMLIYSANTVLVCGDARAEYLVFED